MTSTSSDDDAHPTATASSGPVGRPEDAEVPPGDDTLEAIFAGTRPSGHVLTPDLDVSDQEASDDPGHSEESSPASDPPANNY